MEHLNFRNQVTNDDDDDDDDEEFGNEKVHDPTLALQSSHEIPFLG